MNNIPIHNNLSLPHGGDQSPVHRLISGKTGVRTGAEGVPVENVSYWSAQWWGLINSGLFSRLTAQQQHNILVGCTRELLNEAYFIEKSGIVFCAKMMLLSADTDTAQLYALIAADEATHLAMIEPYIHPDDKTQPSGQFLLFLSKLIEELPSNLLVYLVQIILEGWGLDHYSRLQHGCDNPGLIAIFSKILKDEALHHRSGNVLFDSSKLSPADFELVYDCLRVYTSMVRVGPQTVLSVVARQCGGLSAAQAEEVLAALNHWQESSRKLELLKSLMLQPGMEHLVHSLEESGAFVPMSNAEAAQLFLSLC